MLGASPFAEQREVSFSAVLPASELGQPHVVVPYSFEPGECNRFKLSVWAEVPFQLAPLTPESEWVHYEAPGEWTSTSGGAPNPGNDFWSNPQWTLATGEAQTRVKLLLELEPAPLPEVQCPIAIGVLVLRGSSVGKQHITPELVLAQVRVLRVGAANGRCM